MKLTVKMCLFTCYLCVFMAINAQASEVLGISQQVKGDVTELQIKLTKNVTPKVFVLSEGGVRVVIDLPRTNLAPQVQKRIGNEHIFLGKGGVKQIRYAQRGEKDIRLVADLSRDAKYLSRSYQEGVLRLFIQGKSVQIKTTGPRVFKGMVFPRLKPSLQNDTQVNMVSGIPVPRLKNGRISRAKRKLVVVIDPGHGGHDPGAIGKKKVREETVTLKAALELRKQLLKTGKYKVVLTRSTDKYVALENRVMIARKASADLFISLHADSLSKSSIRGASVYTLADRAQKRGQNLTQTQNWILDVDLASHSAPVANILVDLAQRSTLSKSAEFADILVPQLKKQTVLLGNTHRQAGLYVLLAPDVPAVLLEMGFLSNKKDEALLNSAKHRKKLMKSVTKAINSYFTAQNTLQASR